LVNDDVGNASAEQGRLRNGLALAGFVSRAGDAVGDVLRSCARLCSNFVSKEQISSAFGQTTLKAVSLATGVGCGELLYCGGTLGFGGTTVSPRGILSALLLIAITWLLIRFFLPKNLETEIQTRAEERIPDSEHCRGGHKQAEKKWTRVQNAFVMDWSMLWKEILGGFLIARFLATLIENALVGPISALISSVCAAGHIPLASLLGRTASVSRRDSCFCI
jgi:hypothetical protein